MPEKMLPQLNANVPSASSAGCISAVEFHGHLPQQSSLERGDSKAKAEGPIHILSLGAGVQSSTMALMAARGELTPMPKAAIFADTQNEPKAVMTYLTWLETQLPFPVIRVTRGNLMEDSLEVKRSGRSGKLYMKGLIPAYVKNPDGSKGILGRKCTADYKVEMIVREARKLCAWRRGEDRHLVDMWIGISRDEAHRMKPSRHKWIRSVWPLIDRRLSRVNCLAWMKRMGYPEPPRSACMACPFHSDAEWLRLKTESPEEFAGVVEYERRLIAAAASQQVLRGVPYLHASLKPIGEVEFSDLPGHMQVNLFGNECTGLCGV